LLSARGEYRDQRRSSEPENMMDSRPKHAQRLFSLQEMATVYDN
jgi:hypothetical protein